MYVIILALNIPGRWFSDFCVFSFTCNFLKKKEKKKKRPIVLKRNLPHHLPTWIRSFGLFRHRRIAIVSWDVHDPSLCVFANECFVFLGSVTHPSAKPPHSWRTSLSLLVWPLSYGLSGVARKVIDARKPLPPRQGGDNPKPPSYQKFYSL